MCWGSASLLSCKLSGRCATEPVPMGVGASLRCRQVAWHLPAGTLAFFHLRQGGDLPWAWRFQSPVLYGDSWPLTVRQVSLRLQPWGFCLVAEWYEGSMLSHCTAGEVTVYDSGGASTSVFESCFVLLRTNAMPGAARKFMAVPAFEGLRASEQQR